MPDIGSITCGFRLNHAEFVDEANAEALVFCHEKTGAELLVLQADDDNKCFCIAFRTPPSDDTGVPHILEHSVLNGSVKYPVKEPFAELLKASLYTFLNAMTYPDKTVYPVSSRNHQDFHNLMDVYMDAVFHPNLTRETFLQEGWHYEINSPEDELNFSGVVYNEMLGATSSPESVMVDELESKMFPDNIYGCKSGGDPEAIPNLTYEQFCNFHRDFYHPSNSRILMYGDFNLEDRLRHLDSVLNEFSRREIDSAIQSHPPVSTPLETQACYPITPGTDMERKAYVMRAWRWLDPLDPETSLTQSILSHLLSGTPASPLRKALIDSHLGEDVQAWHDSSTLDTYYTIGVKGTKSDQRDAVIEVIQNTLERLVADGFETRTIESAINTVAFHLREANFGGYSKGLVYALQMLQAWLYDGDPLAILKYEEPLARIRDKVAAGRYFEGFLQQLMLDNPHQVTLLMTPDTELEDKRQDRLRKRLAEIRAALSGAEIEGLVETCRHLREEQLKADTPEALATIPKLPLDCIERKVEVFPFEFVDPDRRLSFAEQPTNGIAYVKILFDAKCIPSELLAYVPFFTQVSMQAGTRDHDFVEIIESIGIETGGMGAGYFAAGVLDQPKQVASYVAYSGKCLIEKIPAMLDLWAEIFASCRLDDIRRLDELAHMARAGMESSITNSGHGFAMKRLAAAHSLTGKYSEMTGGLEQFYAMERLLQDLKTNPGRVVERLTAIRQLLFNQSVMHVHLTGGPDELASLQKALPAVFAAVPTRPVVESTLEFPEFGRNEAFMIPSKVQYVAKGLNLSELGMQPCGSFHVLSKYLSRDYLWNRVRVQGNAYGCFCDLDTKTGAFACCSYRDPNLVETIQVFDEIAERLASLEMAQDDFEKLIIGTMGSLDSPMSPDQKGATALNRYLCGISNEWRQARWEEALACTLDDLRGYAAHFRSFRDQGTLCVFGGEAKIKAHADRFDRLQQALIAP